MRILWFKMCRELELYLGSQTFLWLLLWFFSLWLSFCLRLLWHASTELLWRTRRHHLEPQKSCWVCYQVQGARSVYLRWSVSRHFSMLNQSNHCISLSTGKELVVLLQVPIQTALDMVLTGKNLKPDKAKKLGLVDHLVDPLGGYSWN